MRQLLSITRKELNSYFSSPMMLIFTGVFLVVTLFAFFWVEAFFARGVADTRPLFQWMPILLIFLIAALTMRQWSEEEQTGTMEILLTMPIKLSQLVIGKFLATLTVVIIALLLTLSLPITVSFMGNLDWGTVIGGYLAAILMAGAYIAIGLFVSSRSDNSIVALILTIIVGGAFYLIGSPVLTELVGASAAEIMRALGTGSRFESIERGVIDLRDLAYYLSLTIFFLALNIWSLDRKRWSAGQQTLPYRRNQNMAMILLAINLIIFNIILSPMQAARLDLTATQVYTLSPVTHDLLDNLQEPLLIRGYFSEETHPLLFPLVTQIRDTLKEYEAAADTNIQVEFVDPITNPELEQEANQSYGIRPTPLQLSDRGGTSFINAYFDMLIRYGDQSTTLNLLDMIDIDNAGSGLDIRLRNLEYDLTNSIQRVVYGFQNIDAVLESLTEPARLTLYITPDTLPENLAEAAQTITMVAQDIANRANGRFLFETIDVSDPEAGVDPETLFNQYQIQPIPVSFFSTDTFYLHMALEAGDETQVLYPGGDMSEAEIRSSIEAALKRASQGFLQVVGVWTPSSAPQIDQFGQQVPSLQQYRAVTDMLRENYEVRTVDLSSGQVAADIDTLLIINPQGMSDIERYAVDQYLMRGGSVFIATGNHQIGINQFDGSLLLQPVEGGLHEMLASYGITIEEGLVMDTRNAPFPVQTSRNLGGVVVNELQAIDYPYFVDIRADGMERGHPSLINLPAVTMNWVAPITIDEDANAGRAVTPLLRSSQDSWVTTETSATPDFETYPELGFSMGEERDSQILAVVVEGSFESYFAERPSPFESETTGEETEEAAATPAPGFGLIEKSPNTARLVVIGSAEFLNDNVFRLASNFSSDPALNNLQFVQNNLDWFVEDTALAAIRAKDSTARILNPMTQTQQSLWEAANYIFAIAALIAIGVIWQLRKRAEKPIELIPQDSLTIDSVKVRQEGA